MDIYTTTTISNVAAWIGTSAAIIYGIKKTGNTGCLLGFIFPLLIHSSVRTVRTTGGE